MKKLLLISMLLLSSKVWACDSYEDCMKRCDGDNIYIEESREGVIFHQTQAIKAIAFKLNEISQKLDTKNGITCTEKNDFCGSRKIDHSNDKCELNGKPIDCKDIVVPQ